jgi:hypothetical protein
MSAEYDLQHSSNSPIYDDQKEQHIEYTKEELFKMYANDNDIPDVVMQYIWELEKQATKLTKLKNFIAKEKEATNELYQLYRDKGEWNKAIELNRQIVFLLQIQQQLL